MAAATRNTPSMILLEAFLEMRSFLPFASARLMRWAEVRAGASALAASWISILSAMVYPFLIFDSRRTKPTKDADTTNSTTPIPNRAVRCRPEE